MGDINGVISMGDVNVVTSTEVMSMGDINGW